jgi:hypothetical protein
MQQQLLTYANQYSESGLLEDLLHKVLAKQVKK